MNIGEHLPVFQLENQYGERILSTDLSVGKVFLVFYPWAFSRVCGSELAQLQANLQLFHDRSVRLLAVSVDHKFALRSYAEQEGIDFELLADFWPHGGVASLLGAFDTERGVARRVSLYIKDGIIIRGFETGLDQPRSLEQYIHAMET
ncbi:redoxin domain-containing protein [Glutamicibacter sp. MNS18]|uniref:redoxin domain-containing protein n=1 Tax=Glutamicibacter sp. MNS18 TaxID=2989817 RepID=UPI002235DC3F|nr:redoxin domain-containing protein [Glutamicibacter sp. MNS18]MCW4466269.1 redoxin domain-containing protein [Glutamicibacter sp. MNS18]